MTRAADTRDTGRRTEQLLAAIHAAHPAMCSERLSDAARAVDAFLSDNGPPFRFDRKHIGRDAQIALLILHDELNTLDAIAAGVTGARVDLAVADVGWLLERITRLEDTLAEIAALHGSGPLGTHEGDIARAALDEGKP